MKKIVIFSGAGLDAESGIKTFRDSDGLWENHNIMDVASIDGWRKNRQLVLDFYNKRHKELYNIIPNSAHYDISSLEKKYEVFNITQNVSDLLEKSGCSNVLHLHGELKKMRDWVTDEIFDWDENFIMKTHSCTSEGNLLRPHIVWFGENVPNIDKAIKIVKEADIFVIIGTSNQVYPAADLISDVKTGTSIYVINPKTVDYFVDDITYIKDNAVEGMKKLIEILC